MAVKTITIDMEAYTLLARRKQEGQSFSDVIKTHFGRMPTAAAFRLLVRDVRLSDQTLDSLDRQVRSRRRHPARAAKR
jgi:predicted CopG family antitoxin